MRRSLKFDPGTEQRKYLLSEGPKVSCPRLAEDFWSPKKHPSRRKAGRQAFSTVALSFAPVCDLGGSCSYLCAEILKAVFLGCPRWCPPWQEGKLRGYHFILPQQSPGCLNFHLPSELRLLHNTAL